MTKQQSRLYFIDRAGRVWNTKPERDFDAFQIERGYGLIQNVKVAMSAQDKDGITKAFLFQLDFARPTEQGYDLDIEIDGDGHSSKNDAWKDSVKANHGIKVVHVPGVLTKKRWWGYLGVKMNEALASKEMVHYVTA